MGKLLLHIGQRLMISRRNRSVRQSIILLFTNILLLAGIIFTFEIALILLGVGNIFLPWTTKTMQMLHNLFF